LIEFVKRCDEEFSDARVILASLIAADLCPDKQLLNRVTEEEKDIASHYLAFLSPGKRTFPHDDKQDSPGFGAVAMAAFAFAFAFRVPLYRIEHQLPRSE
jgi:hypothetical protein